MRRIFRILGLGLVITSLLVVAMAGTAFGGKDGPGPAPNSGDGVSDGSGFPDATCPGGFGSGNAGAGPAPNSGDGIPDGSGF